MFRLKICLYSILPCLVPTETRRWHWDLGTELQKLVRPLWALGTGFASSKTAILNLWVMIPCRKGGEVSKDPLTEVTDQIPRI